MSSLPWRVAWSDWTNSHDRIGYRPVKRGGVYRTRRKRPPPRRHRDFRTYADAERFVAELRGVIPESELVVQILAPRCPAPPPPTDAWVPGDWPLGRRGE